MATVVYRKELFAWRLSAAAAARPSNFTCGRILLRVCCASPLAACCLLLAWPNRRFIVYKTRMLSEQERERERTKNPVGLNDPAGKTLHNTLDYKTRRRMFEINFNKKSPHILQWPAPSREWKTMNTLRPSYLDCIFFFFYFKRENNYTQAANIEKLTFTRRYNKRNKKNREL